MKIRRRVPVETVNVLVNTPIGDELLQQITDVSPRIRLSNVYELARAEQKGDFAGRSELDALLAEAEVIYGFRFPKNMIARAPKLKWVQVMSAGVDRFLDNEFRQSSVMMTNVSGIHATPIGELVIELMLMFAKQAPLCFQLKQEKQWQRFMPTVLRAKTVGIVGLGNIGGEVARLAKAFGMRVVAIRRSAKRVARARYVDILLPREQLTRLLSESDFVVLSLPFTSETNKLIGEKELRAMKPTAYLINIARGSIVDEEALIRALDKHWIAGAGLDVFATEPLPPDSRLWEFANVIFSPHIAGGMEDYNIRATELFCENLRRYLSGKNLINVIDKKTGY
jgi:phosphoglycerate dehydrogenase-like enzyme